MFKNVMAYRIGPNWSATATQIETALARAKFVECSPGQDKSVGWTEPRGHGSLWGNRSLQEVQVQPI